jgi:myosin heavy subunit
MLVGLKAEEKRLLKLTRAEDYYYLTQGGSTTCPGMDDAEEFAIIRGAMKVGVLRFSRMQDILYLFANYLFAK